MHFQITQTGSDKVKLSNPDPFLSGIDGGKPTYWDTETDIYIPNPAERKSKLESYLETLPSELKNEQEIERSIKKTILTYQNNVGDLKEYTLGGQYSIRQRIIMHSCLDPPCTDSQWNYFLI